MEDFRRQFLIETAAKLENLHRNLSGAQAFSDASKREARRVLHTVKGTAQTFGFANAGRLAHELETLFPDGETSPISFLEGIERLRRSLIEENLQIADGSAVKQSVISNAPPISDEAGDILSRIPTEFYAQLSVQEKKALSAAIGDDKNLSVLEAVFELTNFAEDLKDFRARLDAESEVIAVFPGAKSVAGKIGFRFLTAGFEPLEDFAEARVVWNFAPEQSPRGIGEVLRQITRHGAEISAQLGKEIEFETRGDAIDFSAVELNYVFEILLHLVRNAVDHAFERGGKIEIRIEKADDGVRLSVADDGRGIDAESVKFRAIKNNLISANEKLSENDLINLIFQPEFSTKDDLSEISGRGIGLDAARSAAEKLGGKLSVASEKNKGARFEVFLPRTMDQPE